MPRKAAVLIANPRQHLPTGFGNLRQWSTASRQARRLHAQVQALGVGREGHPPLELDENGSPGAAESAGCSEKSRLASQSSALTISVRRSFPNGW